MCPDKKLEWFDLDQAVVAEQLVRERWSDTYETSLGAEASLRPDSSPVKVCYLYSLSTRANLKTNVATLKMAYRSTDPWSTIIQI